MSIKMKGLLKGLRYISQIFDSKEQEMQIGYPTDVKHVAHIGWDGPSVNGPSWMNEFRPVSLPSSPTTVLGETNESTTPTKRSTQDLNRSVRIRDSPARDLPELPLPRPSRLRPSSGKMDSPKQSHRRHSAGIRSTGSPTAELSDGSRQSRRHHNSPTIGGPDSPVQDLPLIQKQSQRRKSKGSSGGGSLRSSPRSKAVAATYSDPGSEARSSGMIQSILKPGEEEGRL